jgi:hypothetical protein
MNRASAILAMLLLTSVTAAAQAAAPWRIVTDPNGTNIDQVGLLRTGDGVLHLAWHKRTGPNTEDLLHTAIAPNGAIGPTTPITTGWAVMQNAALVADPGGLRVFFGGIHTTEPGETNDELNTASSVDGGTTWALVPASIAPKGGQAYGSPVAAAARPDGTTIQAWAGTLGTWTHAGLDPSSTIADFQAPAGCCGYDTGLAADTAGAVTLAWYSNATGRLGVYAQAVDADGAPAGPPLNMPGTANMTVGQLGRTPVVARPGGGFYVAFATGSPALNAIRVWRVGAAAATVASTAKLANTTSSIAADATGRLWVVWKDAVGAGRKHVYAARSNRTATVFGARVDAGAPPNAASTYRLDASAIGGSLDVLATFSLGASSTVATWHRRLLPGLTLKSSPAGKRRGTKRPVRFRVLDAGVPITGARVAAGRVAGRTGKNGTVTLALRAGRSHTVRATVPTYTAARLRLRVRR